MKEMKEEKNWYVVVKYNYHTCDGQDTTQEYRYESKEAAVKGLTKHFFKISSDFRKQGYRQTGSSGLEKESGLLCYSGFNVRIDIVEK